MREDGAFDAASFFVQIIFMQPEVSPEAGLTICPIENA
jgi:hypothetical protein